MADTSATANDVLMVPVDLFKWVISVFIGLLIFIGSNYEKAFFRVFGVSDFAADRALSQFAINAFNLLLRPGILFCLGGIWLVAWLAASQVVARYRPLILAAAIAANFTAAGYLSQAEARSDARSLISGMAGRKIWCKARADAWDAPQRAAFEAESNGGNFRLLFESKGYLVLTNVRPRTKEEKNGTEGQALMVKRDDLTFCRVTGLSL